ncbi:MAG: DUF6064 family protein [Xanthobacteraceae bacterium]
MSEWWTYTLSDFLLFSPRVYYRIFELHNRALWPAHVVTLILGLAIFVLLLRKSTRATARAVPALLGALWIWIAWAFFWDRYATINWAALYVAPAFALQGLLLLWIGTVGRRLTFAPGHDVFDRAGLALLAFALVGYPLLAPLMGRPWPAAEVFGIAPDPTAVATLAVLAVAHGRARWLTMPIPLLWCAITAATLWTMGAGDFFVAPIAALGAIAIASARKPVPMMRCD